MMWQYSMDANAELIALAHKKAIGHKLRLTSSKVTVKQA
jgi:hypothetical protein